MSTSNVNFNDKKKQKKKANFTIKTKKYLI